MLRLASSSACLLSPMCWTDEPQQPEPATFTTSTPCRVSSRTVASLTSGASTCWPQPGISATRLTRWPTAGKVCGRSTGEASGMTAGIASIIALIRRRKVAPPGSLLRAGSAAASGLASQPSTVTQRNRRGRGISTPSSRRSSRSASGRV